MPCAHYSRCELQIADRMRGKARDERHRQREANVASRRDGNSEIHASRASATPTVELPFQPDLTVGAFSRRDRSWCGVVIEPHHASFVHPPPANPLLPAFSLPRWHHSYLAASSSALHHPTSIKPGQSLAVEGSAAQTALEVCFRG